MSTDICDQDEHDSVILQYDLQATALLLFDVAQPQHGLADRFRAVLAIAASYYADALIAPTAHPARQARDQLLTYFDELQIAERRLAACVVAIQWNTSQPELEPSFVALGQHGQHRAVILANILSLATAITKSGVHALRVELLDKSLHLLVDGPRMLQTASALIAAQEGWRQAIGSIRIEMASLDETDQLLRQDEARLRSEIVQPSGSSSADETARHILRHLFERMLSRELALRHETGSDDVHQMQTASQRLRAALQVVDGIFGSRVLREFRREIGPIVDLLSDVHDLDIFVEHVHAYQCGDGSTVDLNRLSNAAMTARTIAILNLHHALEGKHYYRFRHDFARFLTTPGASSLILSDIGRPPRVRDVAGSQIWQRYEALRAFEVSMTPLNNELLLRLRLAGRRLHYTLEFYRDILGSDTDSLLSRLSALHDQLGQIRNASIARTHIDALEMRHDKGAQAYLNYLEAQQAQLLEPLPALWEAVTGEDFKGKLQAIIVAL